MPGRNPTIRRRELGAALRALRTASGMSIEDVAANLMISGSQISRIETGQRKAKTRDVAALCDVYAVDAGTRATLMSLAQLAQEAAWWEEYEIDLTKEYWRYIGFEDAASSIAQFSVDVVPGLLQTEDYSRAVITGMRDDVDPHSVDRMATIRRQRQQILSRPDPPDFRVVLDESILRRRVGTPAVMRAQFEHIIEQSTLPHIRVQVLPFDFGAHPLLGSPFTVLHLPQDESPDVLYAEGLQQVFWDKPKDVTKVLDRFEDVSRRAPDPDATRSLIRYALENELPRP